MTLRQDKPCLLPRTTSGVFTLDVCIAIQTLLEAPGPDEPLTIGLELWVVEGLSSLTSSISLPAFGKGSESMRMFLQLAMLE